MTNHATPASSKPRPGGPSALVLTPLALSGKTAALPLPRTHRQRYYVVLAPNASLRAALTARAPVPVPPPPPADSTGAQQASALHPYQPIHSNHSAPLRRSSYSTACYDELRANL